ncbi:hypothetical protein RV03_GL003586 [Enterococcus gallinarum]|nr:hypothetical protein RV03_GL003586 [Enterococcus gallinarum]
MRRRKRRNLTTQPVEKQKSSLVKKTWNILQEIEGFNARIVK